MLKYVHYRLMNFSHSLKQMLWTGWITAESFLWALKSGMYPRDTPVTPTTRTSTAETFSFPTA